MAQSDSVRYKTVVVGLLSLLIGLLSWLGGTALTRLETLQTAVTTLQATASIREGQNLELTHKVDHLTERMDLMERQLTPQIEYLTKWLDRTFGVPAQRTTPKFERQ